jgi:hypothetical protein
LTRKDRIQFLRADGVVGPPPPGFLRYGEPAVDEDGNLYVGLSDGTIIRVGGADIGAQTQAIIIFDTQANLLASNPASNGVLGFAQDTGNSFMFITSVGWQFQSAGNFLELPDTPNTYAGASGNVLQVDVTETGIEFSDTVDGGNF